jgi:1,2-diacylglycerol-3-alpha-glucose alpha-1,2-glucosyltransferase
VYHAHSTYEDFRNSFIGSNLLAPLYGWYLKQLYRRADHLITPTPYAKQLLRNYGLTQPITPLSNGIDLAQYAPDAHKVAAFRDYFELNAQQKVVMSVGLFFARKGILDFVALAKRHPEWTFIWFGYTDLHLIPRDIRRIVQGQHPDNLIFPGYITGDVLEGAFQGADAFVYPSYEETEGIVVLEALASKQNVIVRDIPVYADWLLDGQNVHKAKDLEMFDDKLTQLLAGQLPSVVQAGYEVAQQRDLPVIGQKLARVYEDVIQQN